MEKNKGNVLVIAGIVLVLVTAVIFAFTKLPQEQPVVGDTASLPEGETEVESTLDTTGATAVNPVSISYSNTLAQYKDRRIQLDTVCQAHPNTITYKDNTGIMIDNRSSKTRTVKIGTTFTIKPYGFKIFVLPNITTAPRTILVDCDASQNVATILFQE